mmetsp:Transcript_23855/g.33413  ORF Transcript_23855/g.33413 Transcript_23855/m.33413 type:complete len:83 (+) Transcript_23855:381-629(+)
MKTAEGTSMNRETKINSVHRFSPFRKIPNPQPLSNTIIKMLITRVKKTVKKTLGAILIPAAENTKEKRRLVSKLNTKRKKRA